MTTRVVPSGREGFTEWEGGLRGHRQYVQGCEDFTARVLGDLATKPQEVVLIPMDEQDPHRWDKNTVFTREISGRAPYEEQIVACISSFSLHQRIVAVYTFAQAHALVPSKEKEGLERLTKVIWYKMQCPIAFQEEILNRFKRRDDSMRALVEELMQKHMASLKKR